MIDHHPDPKWLKFLAHRFGWLAVPHIAVIFLTLQALGFLFTMGNPIWFERFALIPERVLSGEPWRLITFLALPLSQSLLGIFFALWFLYFVLNMIEAEWGAFKTTTYILVSVSCTIAFSLATGHPIFNIQDLVGSLFLAAAILYPESEIHIYFAIPVKMKFLGWLALAFVCLRLWQGDGMTRLHILTLYSNALIFFGPRAWYRFKQWKRKRDFHARF